MVEVKVGAFGEHTHLYIEKTDCFMLQYFCSKLSVIAIDDQHYTA